MFLPPMKPQSTKYIPMYTAVILAFWGKGPLEEYTQVTTGLSYYLLK